jgi:hypothetical protein
MLISIYISSYSSISLITHAHTLTYTLLHTHSQTGDAVLGSHPPSEPGSKRGPRVQPQDVQGMGRSLPTSLCYWAFHFFLKFPSLPSFPLPIVIPQNYPCSSTASHILFILLQTQHTHNTVRRLPAHARQRRQAPARGLRCAQHSHRPARPHRQARGQRHLPQQHLITSCVTFLAAITNSHSSSSSSTSSATSGKRQTAEAGPAVSGAATLQPRYAPRLAAQQRCADC